MTRRQQAKVRRTVDAKSAQREAMPEQDQIDDAEHRLFATFQQTSDLLAKRHLEAVENHQYSLCQKFCITSDRLVGFLQSGDLASIAHIATTLKRTIRRVPQ